MAGLSPWLAELRLGTPGDLRSKLKLWFIDHPEEAVTLLPEWTGFIELLRT